MFTFIIGSVLALFLIAFCCAFLIEILRPLMPLLGKGFLLFVAIVVIAFFTASMTAKTAPSAHVAPTETVSGDTILVNLD